MRKKGIGRLIFGIFFLILFALLTVLVQKVDLQPIGPENKEVGFASINGPFHEMTGFHESLYNITDVMGSIPFLVCLIFAAVGLIQLIRRKSLGRVDQDIILLGIFYIVVIACFFVFQKLEVNYRPVLIDGRVEVSYPSSTTLLVISVFPTAMMQIKYRLNKPLRTVLNLVLLIIGAFMVVARTIAGVHWLTDILGGALFGVGVVLLYAYYLRKVKKV